MTLRFRNDYIRKTRPSAFSEQIGGYSVTKQSRLDPGNGGAPFVFSYQEFIGAINRAMSSTLQVQPLSWEAHVRYENSSWSASEYVRAFFETLSGNLELELQTFLDYYKNAPNFFNENPRQYIKHELDSYHEIFTQALETTSTAGRLSQDQYNQAKGRLLNDLSNNLYGAWKVYKTP